MVEKNVISTAPDTYLFLPYFSINKFAFEMDLLDLIHFFLRSQSKHKLIKQKKSKNAPYKKDVKKGT